MLITFKSSAAGDVIMLEENGKELLGALGRDPGDAKGIFTVEQLPAALATLNAAIVADKAGDGKQSDHSDQGESGLGGVVRLSQRAFPLLEMLQLSLKEQAPVTWGV
jgi:hypothetical protein